MDISRRQLASVLAGATAVTASAQAPPVQPADDAVETARAGQRASTQTIARVPLPMSTEPAFRFKA
jgi:hypothetical protein